MSPEAPPVIAIGVDAVDQWRTATDHPLTSTELASLREACGPRPFAAWFDAEQRAAPLYRDNPSYRPGGVGLAAASPTGVGALDNPASISVIRRKTMVLQPLDERLAEKARAGALAAALPPAAVALPIMVEPHCAAAKHEGRRANTPTGGGSIASGVIRWRASPHRRSPRPRPPASEPKPAETTAPEKGNSDRQPSSASHPSVRDVDLPNSASAEVCLADAALDRIHDFPGRNGFISVSCRSVRSTGI